MTSLNKPFFSDIEMPSILIAFPFDFSSVILADKLRSHSECSITLFIDLDIDNWFQNQAFQDLKCVCPDVRSTSDKVVYKIILL